MKKFILTGRIADTDHARISKALLRRMLPWGLRAAPLILAFVVLIVIYALPMFEPLLAADYGLILPSWTPMALLGAMIVGLILLIRARRKRIWASMTDTPLRRGDRTFALSPDGLRMKGATGYSFTTWTGFVDVVDDPQGLLVLTGPLDYVVLPQAAFADAAEKAAVKAQIADWIAAARG